jgi:hypothetical protein
MLSIGGNDRVNAVPDFSLCRFAPKPPTSLALKKSSRALISRLGAQVGLASISLISVASLQTADELWQAARRVVRLAAKIDRLF